MILWASPDHVLSPVSGDALHVLVEQVVYHEVPICVMGRGVVCDAAGGDAQTSQNCRVEIRKPMRTQHSAMCRSDKVKIVFLVHV